MSRAKKVGSARRVVRAVDGYGGLFADVVRELEDARRAAARSINAVMTATYWLVGRRIVEHEQGGAARASYGEALLDRLAAEIEKTRREIERRAVDVPRSRGRGAPRAPARR